MQVHAHRIAVTCLEPVVLDQARRAAVASRARACAMRVRRRMSMAPAHVPCASEDGRGRAVREGVTFQIVLAGAPCSMALAVPMALVPTGYSRQHAPVRNSTRCAMVRVPWSPTVVQQHAVTRPAQHHAVAAANLAVTRSPSPGGRRQHPGAVLVRQVATGSGRPRASAFQVRGRQVTASLRAGCAIRSARLAVVQRAGQAAPWSTGAGVPATNCRSQPMAVCLPDQCRGAAWVCRARAHRAFKRAVGGLCQSIEWRGV